MKCSVCGNEYSSQYYFAAPNICNDCFQKMTPDEQNQILSSVQNINVDVKSIRIGFGRRLGAYLIDLGIIMAVILVVIIANGFIKDQLAFGKEMSSYAGNYSATTELTRDFMKQHFSSYLFMSILPLFYFMLEAFVGASLGKMILGIQIGGLNADKAGTSTLFFRYFLKSFSSIIGLVGTILSSVIIGYIGQGFSLLLIVSFFFTLSQNRLALHDIIAKTAVYFKRDLVSENV